MLDRKLSQQNWKGSRIAKFLTGQKCIPRAISIPGERDSDNHHEDPASRGKEGVPT